MDKSQTYTIIWLIHHAFANGMAEDAIFNLALFWVSFKMI
jgi:hypothetical protein